MFEKPPDAGEEGAGRSVRFFARSGIAGAILPAHELRALPQDGGWWVGEYRAADLTWITPKMKAIGKPRRRRALFGINGGEDHRAGRAVAIDPVLPAIEERGAAICRTRDRKRLIREGNKLIANWIAYLSPQRGARRALAEKAAKKEATAANVIGVELTLM